MSESVRPSTHQNGVFPAEGDGGEGAGGEAVGNEEGMTSGEQGARALGHQGEVSKDVMESPAEEVRELKELKAPICPHRLR